jgi:hypothetical protein
LKLLHLKPLTQTTRLIDSSRGDDEIQRKI